MDKANLKFLVNQANHEREVYDAKIKSLLLDVIGHCQKCGKFPAYGAQYGTVQVCATKLTEMDETGALGWSMSDRCLGVFKISSSKCEA